jgi:hypothetical protein
VQLHPNVGDGRQRVALLAFTNFKKLKALCKGGSQKPDEAWWRWDEPDADFEEVLAGVLDRKKATPRKKESKARKRKR